MSRAALLGLLLWLGSCSGGSGDEPAEDAQDAGREYIRALLDGNYRKALSFLYRDPAGENMAMLDEWRQQYNLLPEEEKINFKGASIRALQIEVLSDSSVNYRYTNSYQAGDTSTIKIIRVKDRWLVDP